MIYVTVSDLFFFLHVFFRSMQDKNKFLVPVDLTVGQFAYVIRRRLTLPPTQALFLFIANSLPATSAFMRELYSFHKDVDGFL